MTLYEKLVQAYKDRAKQSTPGNSLILGEKNMVPEMMAQIAIEVVYTHLNDEERKELNDVVTGA